MAVFDFKIAISRCSVPTHDFEFMRANLWDKSTTWRALGVN